MYVTYHAIWRTWAAFIILARRLKELFYLWGLALKGAAIIIIFFLICVGDPGMNDVVATLSNILSSTHTLWTRLSLEFIASWQD